MPKFVWIMKKIREDLKRRWRSILKLLSLWVSLFFVGRVMKFFGIFEWYLPTVLIVILVVGVYIWYDHEFKWEQKKIIEELKEKK